MNWIARAGTGRVFVLSIAIIGLVLGKSIGGRCCTPADSGLAVGAIVFGYGIVGRVFCTAIAVAVVIKLPAGKEQGARMLGAFDGQSLMDWARIMGWSLPPAWRYPALECASICR